MPTLDDAIRGSGLPPPDARALAAAALGLTRAQLVTRGPAALDAKALAKLAALFARRRAGEPVAYLTGEREFYGLSFRVTPAVLIPRPESELLVDFALEVVPAAAATRVLDLGTGSGCVAIAIAHHRPQARVTAVDRSSEALAVARANAEALLIETPSPSRGEGWDGGWMSQYAPASTPTPALPLRGGGRQQTRRLTFMESDWFAALGAARFALIVANPPYVAAGDPHLAQGDLRFEPAAALASGADGLDAIRAIIAGAPAHLDAGGWLVFEHGYDQAAACRELLTRGGFEAVFSRRDLAAIERVSGGRRGRDS